LQVISPREGVDALNAHGYKEEEKKRKKKRKDLKKKRKKRERKCQTK